MTRDAENNADLTDAAGAALSSMVGDCGPGLFGLIADDSQVLFSGSAGSADLQVPRPILAADRFRIGSLTKTYVATVVLQLIGEGVLGLDDSVQRYLPRVVPEAGPVTVRHLLQLRSGLPDYVPVLADVPALASTAENWSRYWSPQELTAIALTQPDRRAPGEGFRYSNTDYIVLGLMIEAVTGEHLDAALWRRVFYPLGLRETDLPTADPYLRGPHATGYLRLPGGELQDFTTVTLSESWASGAIISTPIEVVTFLDALFGGRLLPPAQLAVMLDVQPVDQERAYGCGLYRYLLTDGRALYGHRGTVIGFSCLAVRSPSGRTLVLYRNCLDMETGPLPLDTPILQAAFGGD